MIPKFIKRYFHNFIPDSPVTAGELHSYVASTHSQIRWVLLLLIFAIFVLCLALVRVSYRDPTVIRIDQLGQASAVSDYKSINDVYDVEVNAFAKEFVKSIIEVNSYSLNKDLARALNMMTKPFQEAHKKKLQSGNYIAKIRQANIQRDFEIERLVISGRTDVGYELDVRGTLSTKPLDDPAAPLDRGGLLGQLYIVKVPRSATTPYGLLVSNFRWSEVPLEEIYKKEEVKLEK